MIILAWCRQQSSVFLRCSVKFLIQQQQQLVAGSCLGRTITSINVLSSVYAGEQLTGMRHESQWWWHGDSLTWVTRAAMGGLLVSWVSVGNIAPLWLTVEVLYGASGHVGMVGMDIGHCSSGMWCQRWQGTTQGRDNTSESVNDEFSLSRARESSLAISTSMILFLFEKSFPTPIQHLEESALEVHGCTRLTLLWEEPVQFSAVCNAAVVMPASSLQLRRTAVNPTAVQWY